MRYYSQEDRNESEVYDYLYDILNPLPEPSEEEKAIGENITHKNYDELKKSRNEYMREYMKPLLLQHLPEPLWEYVTNGMLVEGTALSEDVTGQIKEVMRCMKKEEVEQEEAWRNEMAAIKDKIPETVLKYIDGRLHDSKVLAVCRPCNGRLEIKLDSSASYCVYRRTKLIFNGVKDAILPENMAGSWWIENEYHLSDKARFEVQVMLDKGREDHIELSVEADELTVEHLWKVRTSSAYRTKCDGPYKR